MSSGQPGLQVAVHNPDDPLAFFSLFFTPEILNVIVTKTNRRAAQLISQMRARPHARLNNWSDTNANEIGCFHRGDFIPGNCSEAHRRFLLDNPFTAFHPVRAIYCYQGQICLIIYYTVSISLTIQRCRHYRLLQRSFHKLKGFLTTS